MTVTIELPPELEKAARTLAAARGESVDVLARDLLAGALIRAIEDAEDIATVREFEVREARGEIQWEDWESVKAELDALPD